MKPVEEMTLEESLDELPFIIMDMGVEHELVITKNISEWEIYYREIYPHDAGCYDTLDHFYGTTLLEAARRLLAWHRKEYNREMD